MKATLTCFIPMESLSIQLVVSGRCSFNDYLIALAPVGEGGERLTNKVLNIPVHSSLLGLAAIEVPELVNEDKVLSLNVDFSTPVSALVMTLVKWGNRPTAKFPISVKQVLWRAARGPLHLGGRLTEEDWK